MSDIDPGTPANGGLSALTKRDGVADANTTSLTNNELIAALEKATGPDSELDYEIRMAIWTKPKSIPKPYTSSIDAALTLVPESACFRLTYKPCGKTDCVVMKKEFSTPYFYEETVDAATPAIAICIAVLKARGAGDAALEAALTVRKPTQHNDVLHALRGVTPDNKLASDAADLIERKTEEIAELNAELIPSRELIDVLRAERADLIEALRPFAEESNRPEWSDEHPDTLIASYTDLYFRDLARARAILERLGAKEVK